MNVSGYNSSLMNFGRGVSARVLVIVRAANHFSHGRVLIFWTSSYTQNNTYRHHRVGQWKFRTNYGRSTHLTVITSEILDGLMNEQYL